MPIEVLTKADRYELASLARIQLELGLDDAEVQTHGYYLTTLIRQASSFVTRYTDRVLAEETVSERLSSVGSWRLVLSRYPVSEVLSVAYRGTPIDPSTYMLEDAESGFLWREGGWTSTVAWGGWIAQWPTRFKSYDWEVVYTAGYRLPHQEYRTLPYDLEQACVDIIKTWYKERDRSADIVSEKIGEASVTYRQNTSSVPSRVLASLDKYKAL